METHLRPGDVALDVGANAGQYSRILRDRGCKVIAFEPNPKIARQCRDNVAGIEVVESAVSDRIGHTAFYVATRPYALASSFHQLNGMVGQTEKITVSTTTVDAFCRDRKVAPKFIKIDVEGNELSVIKGAQKVICRHRPYIIFEFWESWWNRGGKDIFAMLNPRYELIVAQTGMPAFSHYNSLGSQLDASNETVDIICTPRSRLDFEPCFHFALLSHR
jgi:FkbM family methyltransferase